MKLIVGLGNPGKKFGKTRHNLGFRVIDDFAKQNKFPDFNFSKKFKAEISQKFIYSEKIILAKPQTFMNNSGQSVKILVSNFYFLTSNIWVVHDDFDLPLGTLRIVRNRGAAGHKGVQSIIDKLGTKNFVRFRIGIRPKQTKNREQKTEKFVLQKFNKEEEKIVKKVIEKLVEAIEFAIREEVEKAMSEFNK